MTSGLLAAVAGAAVGALAGVATHAVTHRRRPALHHRVSDTTPAGSGGHLPDGVALRYSPDALRRWWPAALLAARLRRRGLRDWPEAVGIWWPEPGGAGVMVCRDCIEHRPGAAIAGHHDSDQALVLTGIGARRRVEHRCAVHTGRSPPTGTSDITKLGVAHRADPPSQTGREATQVRWWS